MSDRMRVVAFDRLVNWVLEEYAGEKTIFGIAEKNFCGVNPASAINYCGKTLGAPLGPAAGPHTQLAQNLAAGYLTGGRFFELKTVQVLDRLTFPKPCINAADEGYNTEWSTELSIEEAYAEYVKGWFLLHLIGKELFKRNEPDFIFNMSVGYDLEGIKSAKVDQFIEGLKDASKSKIFAECKAALKASGSRFRHLDNEYIDNISADICNTISLSTMHGCPPPEIEAICAYLLREKQLHTYVKLNPTMLGYDQVRSTLDAMGYDYIMLKEESFSADLQYAEGLAMIKRLQAIAAESNREFGVKLSNTLPVKITGGELTGEMMYLSGKPLYALTINLASKLAAQFEGKLKISYSGGADHNNTAKIISTGIRPVTVVTTLLKPGGYARINKLAAAIEPLSEQNQPLIDLPGLEQIVKEAVTETAYRKKDRTGRPEKAYNQLPLFDCRASCSTCAAVCPNRANIVIKAEESALKFNHQILHLDGLCNECGNCATFCPYGGIPYREKLTLFWFEEDFNDSSNNGFILSTLQGTKQEGKLKIRVDGAQTTLAAIDPAILSVIRTITGDYHYLL
ncbi:MAG: selenate reductase [Dethiobacteria bacterium]|nr:selenate reductase [Dethiobacteria bacterium]